MLKHKRETARLKRKLHLEKNAGKLVDVMEKIKMDPRFILMVGLNVPLAVRTRIENATIYNGVQSTKWK